MSSQDCELDEILTNFFQNGANYSLMEVKRCKKLKKTRKNSCIMQLVIYALSSVGQPRFHRFLMHLGNYALKGYSFRGV